MYFQSSPAGVIIFFGQLYYEMFARISHIPLVPRPPEKWHLLVIQICQSGLLPVHDLFSEQLLVVLQPPQQLLHRQLEIGVVGRVGEQVLWLLLLLLNIFDPSFRLGTVLPRIISSCKKTVVFEL